MDIKKLLSKFKNGSPKIPMRYFEEEASFNGFLQFCRANIPLVAVITFTLFYTFGIKLWMYSIGIDVELNMAGYGGGGSVFGGLGRWGYAIFNLVTISDFNPFTSYFLGFCVFWLFSILWCYFVQVFSNKTGTNNKLIPFAVVFMTMQVWIEMFYFTGFQSQFIILVCPVVIYLFYKGFLDNERPKIIAAFILLTWIISCYQGILPLYAFGVFAFFIIVQENSDYDKKVYNILCLKLFISLLLALGLYFCLDELFLRLFKANRIDYLNRMMRWGKDPVASNLNAIKNYFINLTLGKSRLSSFNYLLPAAVLFFAQVVYTGLKKVKPGRRVLFYLAAVGIPLTIMIYPVAGAYSPPLRAQYSLPFAIAFMFYYLTTHYKKIFRYIVIVAMIGIGMYQAQIGSQMFYSDYMRYQEDVRLAGDFARRLGPFEDAGNNIPVVFVGKIRAAHKFKRNFIEGEIVGRSFWGLQGAWTSSPIDGLSFMRTIGLNYPFPNQQHLDAALKVWPSMPSYPVEGCVVKLEECIVFKLSDDLYGW